MPKPAVLLVDDEPRNLLALREVVEGCGADVALAGSGASALRLLLKQDFSATRKDVLAKPVCPEVLRERLARALGW